MNTFWSRPRIIIFICLTKENILIVLNILNKQFQRGGNFLRKKAVSYLGEKCSLCGYDTCIDALEFHHIDPTQKDFGISYKGITRSWDKIKDELDKCVLVCSNCHKEIHAGLVAASSGNRS